MDRTSALLHARLTSTRRRFARAAEETAAHIDRRGGYVAWSGGKDSTVCAHLAASVRPGAPIVTYVAGTEYPEVLPYCTEVADSFGWRWEEHQTGDIMEHLRAGGDVGDAEWWEIMIAGPAKLAHAAHGSGLVWGLRADESHARAMMLWSTRGEHTRKTDGVTTWAPLWQWSSADVYGYLAAHDVPPCPVYDRMEQLGMSEVERRVGRMLGRRGATTGRYAWLKLGWPSEWERLAQVAPWLRDVS